MALLEVKNLFKAFGGIQAVSDCTFSVEQGSITGLIGPNGAGKTTAFNMISGVLKPDSGQVWFDGKRIDGLQPHKITRSGMSRTFQITRNLENMTVLENLVVQAPVNGLQGLFGQAIKPEERDRAMNLLDFMGITHLAYEETRSLSYGQKKLMDFAALLMAKPRLVLLDEPAGGVNPALLEEIVTHIKELNEQGITFLIVEHNMDLVMGTCDPIVVMAAGTVIAQGPPTEIQNDPEVLEAYLGRERREST
ncbi:MAG: ABC transporter ATP-binding protein [Anaerolineae bacterium]|nr:ABC transporter ATP-binding protein [Anaerolineae bacterium]